MWSIAEYLLAQNGLVCMISTHNQMLNKLCQTYQATSLIRIEALTHSVVWLDDIDLNDLQKGNLDGPRPDVCTSDVTQLDQKQFNKVFFQRLSENK